MDPFSVLKTLWKYKWMALPIVLLTALACSYVLFLCFPHLSGGHDVRLGVTANADRS